MLERHEQEQLEKSLVIIRILWGALLGSLAVYVLVCKIVEDQLRPVPLNFPIETLQFVLYGVSAFTLGAIFFLRKIILKKMSERAMAVTTGQTAGPQHPAAGSYLSLIIVVMALCETIAVYGLVLFFLNRDTNMLYQFIIVSAVAMIFFRPRKEELLQLAEDINKRSMGKQL